MFEPSPTLPRSALCALVLLALTPVTGHATGGAGVSAASLASAAAGMAANSSVPLPEASPYRLKVAADRLQKAAPAAYVADARYRLAPELQAGGSEPALAETDLSGKPFARQIDAAAREAGIDPALVHAVVSVESAYRASAVSPKGAVGLMQVLPQTASRYGVADPSAVSDNLRAGTRHLRWLIDRYDDRLELALAAYNAGEGAVSRYHERIPPYAETRDYVPKVIASYRANGKRGDVAAVTAYAATARRAAIDYLPGTRLDTRLR